MQLHYKNMALNKDNTRVQTREIDASFDLQQKPQEHGLESRREKQMPVLVFSKTVQERNKRKGSRLCSRWCGVCWILDRGTECSRVGFCLFSSNRCWPMGYGWNPSETTSLKPMSCQPTLNHGLFCSAPSLATPQQWLPLNIGCCLDCS